jgi:hypothetical protein
MFLLAHDAQGWQLLDATGRRCRGSEQLTMQFNKNSGCHVLMTEGIVVVHD